MPYTGTGLQRLNPAHLTPLLIASILLVTSKSLSTLESTQWTRTFEKTFHLTFSELDMDRNIDRNPQAGSTDMTIDGLGLEEDRKGYMDALGLLIFCQAEVGGKRSLSGYIAWAHQVILDSVGLGENVREDEWRALWDAFYVSLT